MKSVESHETHEVAPFAREVLVAVPPELKDYCTKLGIPLTMPEHIPVRAAMEYMRCSRPTVISHIQRKAFVAFRTTGGKRYKDKKGRGKWRIDSVSFFAFLKDRAEASSLAG